jgi:hypothetical protein
MIKSHDCASLTIRKKLDDLLALSTLQRSTHKFLNPTKSDECGMCHKHAVKRKQKFESRETKKFSLKPPNSAQLTTKIRAYISEKFSFPSNARYPLGVSRRERRGVAPVGADVLIKQQKQRSHQLGETPTDRRRHLAAFPSYTCLFVLCVFVRRCWCAAQGKRFVQLTAAAPFLLTSSQPCFKTLCVCAPSATTGGGGWLHSALKIKLRRRRLLQLAFHSDLITRRRRRRRHLILQSRSFGAGCRTCGFYYFIAGAASSQSTSRETSFCDTKLCAAKELKAAW